MSGAELRARRLAAGITQEELGKRAGLTEVAVSQFERGVHAPNRRTVRALMRGLGLEEPAPTQAPDGARYLELADGRLTLVDAADFDRFRRYRWKAAGSGYVQRQERDAEGVWRAFYLHREVLSAPDGVHVHHRDKDKLNNRRTNLTTMTPGEHLRLHRLRQQQAGS